jgi:hypothetical protein
LRAVRSMVAGCNCLRVDRVRAVGQFVRQRKEQPRLRFFGLVRLLCAVAVAFSGELRGLRKGRRSMALERAANGLRFVGRSGRDRVAGPAAGGYRTVVSGLVVRVKVLIAGLATI